MFLIRTVMPYAPVGISTMQGLAWRTLGLYETMMDAETMLAKAVFSGHAEKGQFEIVEVSLATGER